MLSCTRKKVDGQPDVIMYQKEGGRTARHTSVWYNSRDKECLQEKNSVYSVRRTLPVYSVSEELSLCTAFQKSSPCVQHFRRALPVYSFLITRTLPVYSVSVELSLCTAFQKNSPCVQRFSRTLPVYSVSEELSLCTAFQKNSPRVQRFRRTLPVSILLGVLILKHPGCI